MFINAGAETMIESDSDIKFDAGKFFEGGDTFQTNESMTDAGDFLFIYHTARLGNFHYRFNNLPEGYYYIDFHFVEMINTFGPKGMRVFNVFLQEEKVLSDFEIFSVVGANKPLQLVDLRVSVKNTEAIVIRFEGVIGSPLVSGICIRKAPKLHDSDVKHDLLRCQNCATEIEVPSAQKMSNWKRFEWNLTISSLRHALLIKQWKKNLKRLGISQGGFEARPLSVVS